MDRAKLVLVILLLLTATSAQSQTVPGTDFPFGKFTLRTPPQEDAIPGLGNYYTSLSKGIDTVMWNPASLAKIDHAQTSLGLINEINVPGYTRNYETTDGQETFTDNKNFRVGYFFTGDPAVSTVATREHTGYAFYQTQSTGLKFKQAFKFNDWLTFGFLTQSDTGFTADISGNFPMMAKAEANFLNSSDFMGTGLSIDNSGYLTYTHTGEGGTTYSYKTSQTLWSGFLSQKSNIPLTVISEMRNELSLKPGYTISGAGKWKDLSYGLNFTPISATANINNTARGIVKDGTTDVYIYQPDFDPNKEGDSLSWVMDPNRYGTEAGYKKNTITVPAGEVVAEAVYKGFYQASTLRTDLGFNYDFGDILTLGLALENIGNAALNFKGNGR
ncbi:MAG: hypothetical protein PHH60_04570, partial [Candidatus Margulisbacteria bacterium]|nr:hypothetical protein [Candidatus Margulisiibacteriota bacterium]